MLDGQKIGNEFVPCGSGISILRGRGEKDEGGHERHEDRLVSMGKKQAWRHQ